MHRLSLSTSETKHEGAHSESGNKKRRGGKKKQNGEGGGSQFQEGQSKPLGKKSGRRDKWISGRAGGRWNGGSQEGITGVKLKLPRSCEGNARNRNMGGGAVRVGRVRGRRAQCSIRRRERNTTAKRNSSIDHKRRRERRELKKGKLERGDGIKEKEIQKRALEKGQN